MLKNGTGNFTQSSLVFSQEVKNLNGSNDGEGFGSLLTRIAQGREPFNFEPGRLKTHLSNFGEPIGAVS